MAELTPLNTRNKITVALYHFCVELMIAYVNGSSLELDPLISIGRQKRYRWAAEDCGRNAAETSKTFSLVCSIFMSQL